MRTRWGARPPLWSALALAVGLTSGTPAYAKCALLLVEVEGRLVTTLPPDAELVVLSEPDANATHLPVEQADDVVRATLRFDPTKGYSWWRGHDRS